MKKHAPLTAVFLAYVILAVSGCATPSDLFASNARSIGPGPTNYRQLVQAYMAPRLVDPHSARYEVWDAPVRTYYSVPPESGLGWSVDVSIDDKDPAGNYPAGLRRYRFVLSDGNMVVSYEELRGASCVSSACPPDDSGMNKPHLAGKSPAANQLDHLGPNQDHAGVGDSAGQRDGHW
jgi:hypothetical protein